MRNYLILLLLSFSFFGLSQELNCEVVVNAEQTGNENLQLFKNLERQLKEFINNRAWTNKVYKSQERIASSIVIIVNDYDSDVFEASIQVQASRPVYGSSFTTPIYNFNDGDFNFRYLEFQNLIYNPVQFESNLISVLTFHIYMILGIDADTFSEKGGDEYYRQAQIIMNYSQSGGAVGWKLEDGRQSRFSLITDILSPTFKEYRDVMYTYHREGLDIMALSANKSKSKLVSTLNSLNALNRRRPNSFLMRVFFDAKAEEIKDIFSGGPQVNITELVTTLNRIAPMHSSKWSDIEF